MAIILNESEWARDAIINRQLGRKPSETLTRIARYYLDHGYKKRDVKQMLNTFIIQCDPNASMVKWSDAIDRCVAKALKNDTINIEYIPVTKPELETIRSLNGKQIQRLAFTLLVLSKYWNKVLKSSGYWVNSKDSEIMAMANIGSTIKRQSALYHELKERGLIRFSKMVGNTNVQVLFADKDDGFSDERDSVQVLFAAGGTVAMKITDMRNLGFQYEYFYDKGGFIKCKGCGLIVRRGATTNPAAKRSSSPRRYCPACALQTRVNKVMHIDLPAETDSEVDAG